MGRFFLLHGSSRSAVSPLTCRRALWGSSCSAKAAAPCELSRLVRRSSLGMPYRLGGDRRRLIYPRVVSDSRVRSGYLDLIAVPPGYCPDGVPCRSATDKAQSQTRSPGVWIHTAVFSDSERCYWGCQRARQSRLRY